MKNENPANVCTDVFMPAAKRMVERLTEVEKAIYLFSTANGLRIGFPNPFSGP